MGGGGVKGTLSGGMVAEDADVAGVAGVGALPGVGLIGPGGSGTFVVAAELCDPGRKAGSERRIGESCDLDDPFRTSARER